MSPYNPILALSGPQKNRKMPILALYGPILTMLEPLAQGGGETPGSLLYHGLALVSTPIL